MYIVNTSTSIIPIPTRGASGATIVYLSSTTDIGQLVSVFDIDGFLSTPQSLIISTTPGISLLGVSPITLQQRFGYVTLRSESASQWSMVNENAFPVANQAYSVKSLQASVLNVSNILYTTSTVNTSSIYSLTQTIQSSATIVAPLFTSSIVVNNYPAYLAGTNYPYFQALSASNMGNILVQSTLSTSQQGIFLSSVGIVSSLFLQGNMNIQGSYTGSSTLTIQSTLFTTQRLVANSNIIVNREVGFGSNIVCSRNFQTSTMTASQIQTSNMLANIIQFPTGSLYAAGASLTIQSALYISSSFLQVSTINTSEIVTGSLAIGSNFKATTVSTLLVPTAQIQNQNGSVIVSSIVTGALQVRQLYGLNYTSTIGTLTTQAAFFSTLQAPNSVYASKSISTIFGVADVCSANSIQVDILNLGGQAPLQMNNFSISSIRISTALVANQMSSFTTYNTLFDTTGASFITRQVVNSGHLATSTLHVANGILGTSSLYINAPSVSFSTGNIQALTGQIGITSSLYATGISVGAPIGLAAGSPYMYGSTVSGLSSNTPSEFIIGQGTPYSPLHIVASQDRTVNGFLQNPSGLSTYMSLSYIYRTDSTNPSGSASIIVGNPIVQSTLATISSSSTVPYQHFNLQNYSVDAQVVSSTVNYYLTGAETYRTPSILEDQQIILAAGWDLDTVTKFAYSSDGATTWTTLPFVGMELACNEIAWGYDKWVAVGQGATDTMMYSYTGTVWYSLGTAIFTGGGNGVARGATLWLAAGNGTNSIAYSYDGISWAGIGTAIFSSGTGVATDGSSWIATGYGTNTLANSPDGINWTGQGLGVFSVICHAVRSNGTLWVAVGYGTNTLATSTDGVIWAGQNVFSSSGLCVAWNGAQWLAGGSGATSIAISSDGLVWTGVVCPLTIVNNITWSGTQWVATGSGPSASVAVSSDGLTWTVTGSAVLFSEGLAVANRTVASFIVPTIPAFIAAGSAGTALAVSPNGLTWTPLTSPFITATTTVAWNGKIWIAGGSGTYALAYSINGITWTGVTFPNFAATNAIAYGKSMWIAVGTGTGGYNRAQSVDGIAWTQIPRTSGNFFSGTVNGIVWSQNVWVATGTPEASGILFSVTGTSWIPQLNSIFTIGRCVASNGSGFVAGGQGTAALAYSIEGSVWNAIAPGIFTAVRGIAWGSRLWVAAGSGTNTLAYSYDGVQWYGLGTTIFSVQGNSVAWNGSVWVATGQGTNTLATSSDGITWIGQGTTLFSIAGGGVAAIPLPNTTVNRQEPVGIRWNLSGIVQISPTVIEKPPRTNQGWDSRASSLDGYVASAFVQFKPHAPNNYCMVGLTENPTASVSFVALNYAFCLTDAGLVQIYELGTQVAIVGTYAPLDVFQIVFDGSSVSYLQNSVQVRSVARTPSAALYFGSSFNNADTRLIDVEFHPQYQLSLVAPTVPYTYTTINPSGFTSDPLIYRRTVTESVLLPALWQFQMPVSGTLSNSASQLYGELYISTNRLFSTAMIQNPFLPTPSTYTFSYLLTSNVPVVPGNSMEFRIHSQRSLGISQIFSTTLTESIYNLSSTQFVQLVHQGSQQTSDLSVWLANVSTPIQNYVNSNSGIEMNSGFIRWNSRQYGITIQNQYNDMQLRSLTYTGSLFTASDSNLKYDTSYANSSELYMALREIPLNRYKMSDQYRSVFRTEDAHQLGVLTTEVAKKFPALIHPVESEHLGLSNLETVDRIQFRYAHLGATQHLMEKVSTLSGKISERSQRH